MVTATLFDLPATTEPQAPRCRMCVRPARWLTTQQQYAMYCAGKACSNRERICQACEAPFVMSVDGAGTKYCSTDCKAVGYRPIRTPGRTKCAWCGKPAPGKVHRNKAMVWPYICAECLDPIKHVVGRMKAHHVPHERARRLLDDPGCEICGADLLTPIRVPGGGKARAPLVVDHDHSCCPASQHSCGRCVRGLLCSQCNTAAGLLKDSAKYARLLGDYLECWFSRGGAGI